MLRPTKKECVNSTCASVEETVNVWKAGYLTTCVLFINLKSLVIGAFLDFAVINSTAPKRTTRKTGKLALNPRVFTLYIRFGSRVLGSVTRR